MNDCNRHEHDCEHEHGHGHGCDGCVSVEALRSISQKYQGIENDATETVVRNKSRTIEVKLKPQQYPSKYAFPNQGNPAVVYIDVVENESYRWDEETRSYICIGADWHQIRIINGGTANYGK